MTTSPLAHGAIMREAFTHARRIALPTFPALLLFAVAMGMHAYFLTLAGEGANLFLLWFGTGLVTVFVGCFWSADMYRHLLPDAGRSSIFPDAARLFLANLAVYALYFILLFLLTLFFSLFAGVLIGTAGYDPSTVGDSAESVQQSIEALADSGGATVLYILLFIASLGLLWLGMRLFLFGVATVAEGRLAIFRTWPWTRGYVLRIGVLWLVLQALPWLVLSALTIAIQHLAGMETLLTWFGPVPSGPEPSMLKVCIVDGFCALLMAPWIWIGHGLAVALYQRLGANAVDAETTFG
ncbi:MAG: hypothetical protein RIB03_00020 [Henriciella sp.]|uniref:hypothetical protein n=1 Tax=Henriciella sp. TaxID=1968823 RepID=UPI0032ED0D82